MWLHVAEICGKDNLGLVIECSGANIALKQSIEMLRPNGEVVRVGMGFKPLDFSINDITAWNKASLAIWPTILHRRNAIRLLASGAIKGQTDDHSPYRPVAMARRI